MTNIPESKPPKWHDAWHGPCCCVDGSHGLGDEGENMADAADLTALEAWVRELEEALCLANEDAEQLAVKADAFLGPQDEIFAINLKAYDELEEALRAHTERTGK